MDLAPKPDESLHKPDLSTNPMDLAQSPMDLAQNPMDLLTLLTSVCRESESNCGDADGMLRGRAMPSWDYLLRGPLSIGTNSISKLETEAGTNVGGLGESLPTYVGAVAVHNPTLSFACNDTIV